MKSEKTKTIRKISLFAVLAILITMVLAVSVMANETTADGVKGDTCYVIGDVNGDGEVSKKDAVYLLYHSLFGDAYPLEQDGDFDGDKAAISGKDALALLLKMDDESNATSLKVVHAYGEPVWTWKEENGVMSVTAEYACACGEEANHKTVTVVPTEKDKTEATCTKDGEVTYVATMTTLDNVVFTAEKKVVIPATGHVLDADKKACEAKKCANCDYEEAGEGHTLDLDSAKEVADGCTRQIQYQCEECESWVNAGEAYTRHEHTAVITTEATCKTEGLKTYTCVCGDTYTEKIPVNANHSWDAGVVSGDVTVYTCTVEGCGATKTAYNSTSAEVDKDTLASGEVALKNDISISMDKETVDKLGNKVTIGADIVTDSVNVKEDASDIVGENNTVYNLTINGAGADFNGYVTVKVPYTLQQGDDVDAIDVCYIDKDGNVVGMTGTFTSVNGDEGYVSFKTNHFSYYTVTRLTPKQRCKVYGHSDTTQKVEATCTADGYTLHICARCAHTEQTDVVKALGHDNKEDKLAATCTTSGYTKTECQTCGSKKEVVIEATGHTNKETKVAATCTTAGYTHYECSVCGNKEDVVDAFALGHDYKEEWTWDKEDLVATLKLTCQTNGCKDVVEKEAVVGIEKQIAATCEDEGYTNYIAKLKVGATVYDDVYVVKEAQLKHKVTNEWKHNSLSHYKECTLCAGRVDEVTHEFGEGVVKTEPTCTEEGKKEFTCSCGYVKSEAIKATGHTLEDGKCKNCDFTADSCDHETLHLERIDFTAEDGYCNGMFEYLVCECGQEVQIYGFYSDCDMEYDSELVKDENGFVVQNQTRTCKECGIKVEVKYYYEAGEGCTATRCAEYVISDKDGKVLVQKDGATPSDGDAQKEHATIVWVSEDNLKDFGMCEGKVIKTKCICGKYQGVNMNTSCKFEYDSAASKDQFNVYNCKECGAKRENSWKSEEIDKCTHNTKDTYVFYVNDKKVASYDSDYVYTDHEELTYEFTLDGKVCSDGFTVTESCSHCGYKDTIHEKPLKDEHYTYRVDVDFSKYNVCNKDASWAYECPCGERSSASFDYNHSWTDWKYEYDEEGRIIKSTANCSNCDISKEITKGYAETDEPCETKESTTTVYKVGNEVIYTAKQEYYGFSHDYKVIDAVLAGETCEDGVTITRECTKCGDAITNKIHYHENYELATYDLADYGLCGGTVRVYGCVCGENAYWNTYVEEGEKQCTWYWHSSDGEKTTLRCNECGMYRQEYTRQKDITDCYKQYITQFDYMSEYDVLLSIIVSRYGYNHNDTYTFKLDGETCSDGYTVSTECSVCGATRTWKDNVADGTHPGYAVSKTDLTQYGFCGGAIANIKCACGEVDYMAETSSGVRCEREWVKNDETGATWSQCKNCKNYLVTSSKDLGKENCVASTEYKYSYRDKDGKELVSYTRVSEYTSHDYLASFVLDGETCMDGFTVKYKCKNCDESYEQVYEANEYGHRTFTTEKYNAEDYGMCKGYIYVEQCACGYSSYISTSGCNFRYVSWDSETNSNIYKCETCGTTESVTNVKGDKVDCKRAYNITTTFKDEAGKKLFEKTVKRYEEEHDNKITFVLDGETCSDGFTAKYECRDCGKTNESVYQPNEGNGHSWFVMERYDAAEYGLCEGTLQVEQCACGNHANLYQMGGCTYESGKYDETINGYVYTCTKCGSVKTVSTAEGEVADCKKPITQTYVYKNKDGEKVFEKAVKYYNNVHNYEVTDVKMNGTSCEDGYTVTETCKDCKYVNTYTSSWHSTRIVKEYDLADYGACGGEFSLVSCFCKENQWVNYNFYESCDMVHTSNSYVDEDGITHNVSTETCRDCGLRYTDDSTNVYDKTTCTMTRTHNVILTVGKTAVDTFTYVTKETQHDYVTSVAYKNADSTDCEDGVVVTNTCKNCGETYSYESSGHISQDINIIDLKEYGSVCGAYLVERGCLCGYHHEVVLDEGECDFDWNSISPWIENDLYYTGQNTTEGGTSVQPSAYEVICAVTNPACGFTLRTCYEYEWDKATCLMSQYKVWQLGYDKETGKCQKEVKVLVDTFAYHQYKYEYSNANNVSIEKAVCSVCNSDYVTTTTYDAKGNHIKTERAANNTLYAINGENKTRTDIDEYIIYYAEDGSAYSNYARDYYESVSAKDVPYWYEYKYTYGWDDGECTRTYVHTSSTGYTYQNEEEYHIGDTECAAVKEETCSQYGIYNHATDCLVCKKTIVSEDVHEHSPLGHDYDEKDSTTGMWICSRCGLESANGADGNVILEDLTEQHGAGANYVIGYYNNSSVYYEISVCVVNDDDAVVLEGITINKLDREEDGITAVEFSKAEVAAAVKAAGVTGDISVVFSPYGSDGDLDYAITITE